MTTLFSFLASVKLQIAAAVKNVGTVISLGSLFNALLGADALSV